MTSLPRFQVLDAPCSDVVHPTLLKDTRQSLSLRSYAITWSELCTRRAQTLLRLRLLQSQPLEVPRTNKKSKWHCPTCRLKMTYVTLYHIIDTMSRWQKRSTWLTDEPHTLRCGVVLSKPAVVSPNLSILPDGRHVLTGHRKPGKSAIVRDLYSSKKDQIPPYIVLCGEAEEKNSPQQQSEEQHSLYPCLDTSCSKQDLKTLMKYQQEQFQQQRLSKSSKKA